MATTNREPENLDQLIGVLASLRDMPPAQRCRRARALDKVARRILGDVGDEATVELATEQDDLGRRVRTYEETAQLLGVTAARVNHAITSYRKRRGG